MCFICRIFKKNKYNKTNKIIFTTYKDTFNVLFNDDIKIIGRHDDIHKLMYIISKYKEHKNI